MSVAPALRVTAVTVSLATIALFAIAPAAANVGDAPPLAASGEQELVAGYGATAEASRDGYEVVEFSIVAWPVDPATPRGDGFGPREASCADCSTFHQGLDLMAPDGTPVHAIAAGTVVGVDSWGASLGHHVIIEHRLDGVTWLSLYGHLRLDSPPMRVGQAVRFGDVIGLVGATGIATTSHLHFGILTADWTPIDPAPWMAAHVNRSSWTE